LNSLKRIKLIFFLFLYLNIINSFGNFEGPINQDADWTGLIEVKNGIKIVINRQDPVSGIGKLGLKEDLIIGRKNNDNYMFKLIADISIDLKENIYVLDTYNRRIQMFNRNGDYIKTIDSTSNKMDKFRNPTKLEMDQAGNLYVLEPKKIHIYNNKGNFSQSIVFSDSIIDFIITKDRNIIANVIKINRTKEIALFNQKGEKLKTIAFFQTHNPRLAENSRRYSIISHQFSPNLYLSFLNNETAVFGHSSEYMLQVTDFLGSIVMIIKKDEPANPISSQEKEDLINSQIDLLKNHSIKASRKEIEKEFSFPKNKPFFNSIYCDERSNIYVVKWSDKCQTFDVFNREGQYIYEINGPLFPILKIRSDTIYGIQQGETNQNANLIKYKYVIHKAFDGSPSI
jgi:hypothetical protein